jgi:hypothetical protein
MRPSILIVLAVVLGACMGFGATIMELGPSPLGDLAFGTGGAAGNGNGPKAVLEEDNFQFGNLELDARSLHKFTVRNEGKEALQLTFDHVSCGLCTQATPEKLEIPPGEESSVEVSWHANKEGPFQQSATFSTNDPRKPKLAFFITGKVMNSHRIDPPELVFTSISVHDSQSADLKIYSYRAGTLEVLKHEVTDQETADKFDISTEPMPASMLADDPDAKSGVLVHIKIKPGLLLGPIRQKIKFHLNLTGEPVVEVPVSGNITSDVMLVGRGWDSERELLNLGTVSTREGTKANLLLQIYGDRRSELRPKLQSVTPADVLKVSIGEPREAANGRRIQVPIVVEVPQGARQGTFLGGLEGKLGEINIVLNEATQEKMRVFVRFAVGE